MHDAEPNEIKKLATLLELSQALSGALNLKHSLHRVLEILELRHGMFRSAVTLLDGESDLYIEASNGLSAEGPQGGADVHLRAHHRGTQDRRGPGSGPAF